MHKRVPVSIESAHCSTCMMGHVCLPVGMPSQEVEQLDALVKERVRLEKGDVLFRHGETLNALFGLRLGSVKTQLEEQSGQVQITGFYLPGEIIGLDGMAEGQHSSTAIAMEDMQVCFVPKAEVMGFFNANNKFSMNVMQTICGDLKDADDHMVSLAQKNVKER